MARYETDADQDPRETHVLIGLLMMTLIRQGHCAMGAIASNELTRPSLRSFIQERARAMAVSKDVACCRIEICLSRRLPRDAFSSQHAFGVQGK